MRPNLIQTYMNNNNSQVPPNKKDRTLNIDYVLSNRTFIEPLNPKGHLINNSILEAPATISKDLLYDFKSLKKSVNGTANDHELGKVNDIGMKLGGLAIAGYLMTRKQTPLTKAMELVGMASFFGAMSIWPKIALQLPAKLIHGFNIRQEYEDSFGRKKMFFQDPQYIPWDLIDNKSIHKIGNWMGIPKDIENRRELIQEKMRKTAIQNNTMWMLTAGFATPILSAVICNACEKPLKSYLGNIRSKQADKLITNFQSEYPKHKNNAIKDKLEVLYSINHDKELNPQLVDEIKTIITSDIDGVTSEAISKDLDNLLKLNEKQFTINSKVVEKIIENTKKELKNTVPGEKLEEIIPNQEKLTALIEKENFLNRPLNGNELKKLLANLGKNIKQNIKNYNINNPNSQLNEQLILNKLINRKISEGPLTTAIMSNSVNRFNSDIMSNLKNIVNALNDFKAKNIVLDKYVFLKSAAAPETVVANAWNEVIESIPDLLNISTKEIINAKNDRKLAGKMMRDKLEQITSDQDLYDKTVKSLIDKISQLDTKIKVLDTSSASKESYISLVDSVFDDFSSILKGINMPETAKSITGSQGCLKNVQLSFVSNRLLGIRSSLYRLLNTLDFYKRISTLENIPALHAGMPLEVKEELVELCKKISIEGTTSDFITKFYSLRNPQPNLSDKNQIKVANGKVQNKYLDLKIRGGRVDLPNDKEFFKEAMRLLYENDLHPKTSELLSNTVFANEVNEYRKACATEIGDSFYFAKPRHLVHGIRNNASSYRQFLRIGMPPDQMLDMTMREMYNSKKWLKMFGGFGLGLLGITVLSQFFFGRMKIPERRKND